MAEQARKREQKKLGEERKKERRGKNEWEKVPMPDSNPRPVTTIKLLPLLSIVIAWLGVR